MLLYRAYRLRIQILEYLHCVLHHFVAAAHTWLAIQASEFAASHPSLMSHDSYRSCVGGDASEKQRCGNVFSTAGFALRDAQAPWPHVALHGGLQPGVLQFSVFVRFCFSSAFRVWMNVRGIFDPESMICVAHLSADCFGCRTFSVSASTNGGHNGIRSTRSA
jgi:hypothetical protein